MDYIDLEDDHPKKAGLYSVKIKTSIGQDRICLATWVLDKGFIPVDDKLINDEYIYCWSEVVY